MEILYRNKDWLKKHYVELKKTACDIYREFGISPNNLYVWLEKHGIKRREWIRGSGKVKLTCLYCKKTFNTNITQFKKGRKYCLKECSIKAQTGKKKKCSMHNRIEIKCDNCGKKFMEKPSRIKEYKTHFCSRNCKDKGLVKWEILKCQFCGKEFKIKPFKLKTTSKFCSKECRNNARKGLFNPAWNDGSSFEPYGTEFNEELKEKIRRRDDYACQVVGCEERQNGRKFPVHHRDYRKQNNEEYNLITLCHSHHSATNSNRDYWQNYFTGYVSLRKKMIEKPPKEKRHYYVG